MSDGIRDISREEHKKVINKPSGKHICQYLIYLCITILTNKTATKGIMMHNWFECKIRYEKVMENGMNKKITEPYLVDALSFTEVESRIIEEITPFISGEFTVSDIKRANYSELFPCEEDAADRWFKCKLYFITLDEKSGAEKKTATTVLVQAADLRDAIKKLDEGMKGTMADYTIASVAETAIMDVYPYSAEPDVKPEFPDADKR